MKVVCLNTWGGRCGEGLLEWLKLQKADIYCLQEVFRAPTLEDTAVPDGDGHIIDADLYGSLCRTLPDYQGWFSAGSRGYINDSTWLDLPIEYGIATFVHPAISIVAQHSELVSGSFRRNAYGSPPLSRTAQVLRAVDDNGAFTLGHIHGLWQPNGKQDSEYRRRQAKIFKRMLASLTAPNESLLACGDLNLLPNSETFNILNEIGLEQLNQRFAIECTRTSFYKKSTRFADYFLVNNRVTVKQLEVIRQPEISDHCPLILEADI